MYTLEYIIIPSNDNFEQLGDKFVKFHFGRVAHPWSNIHNQL